MKSGNLNKTNDYEVDGRWEDPAGSILVEVKQTNSIRDVRATLVALAYLLHDEPPSARAVCVLVGSRLSRGRLEEELNRLRSVLRAEIATRVDLIVHKGAANQNVNAFSKLLEDVTEEFHAWLDRLIATERRIGRTPQLPPRQIVIANLAQLRLWNRPPVTVKHLQERCSVSYPTVANVLKDLTDKGWLEESDERGVRLRPLNVGEWMELARDHAKLRKVQFFIDPTGHASPEQMIKRLGRLQATNKLPRNIRIGGVLGASSHFPDLDITEAPRLDLCVEGEPTHIAETIDAGLRPRTGPEQRIALAVHVTCDPWTMANEESLPHEQSAGELECLADLIEMGYTSEASEMAHHMEMICKQGHPKK
jgi:DNA-binding transcriptional ArsR family regulator